MRAPRGVISIVALLALSLSYAPRASAWGEYGHLTVCDLAYRELTDDARAELNNLFGTGGVTVRSRDGVARRHYTSFNAGCLEEDAVPRRHPKDHFINVDRGTTEIGTDCPTEESCIFAGIQRDLEILSDTNRSNEDRVFALMAVGHWLGDIHQPLHVSFADDRGGNLIPVEMDTRCGTSRTSAKNLHAVWDNCLLEAGLFQKVRESPGYKSTWSKRTITYRAVDALRESTAQDEKRAFAGLGRSLIDNLSAWSNESYETTVQPDVQYCIQRDGKCRYSSGRVNYSESGERTQTIDAAYLEAYAPIAEERVRRAGFRLAHLLNTALDPNYSAP